MVKGTSSGVSSSCDIAIHAEWRSGQVSMLPGQCAPGTVALLLAWLPIKLYTPPRTVGQ